MLLRITFCNTKRFLKNTIHTFKSYFAGGYQKLPKTPPCNPFSCTGSRLHVTRFNHGYTQPETITNHRTKTAATVKELVTSNFKEPNYEVDHNNTKKEKKKKSIYEEGEVGSSKCLVTRKLKELEMMDQNNVDLVLDIEEVLHYYSRLTCPVYRDIIDKFFVEMYSGTFVMSRVDNSVSKKLLI
ncbi:hypothetical protein QVD17_26452 [Tagetes erecta]|uniref:Uncharacterized protein n=1 Tax=Tagetes erecta TaxID=13708 RepID=A0AAD8KCY2_TARER|nr:hypothetical protein QVD17_26452 [Tagetes erecta]